MSFKVSEQRKILKFRWSPVSFSQQKQLDEYVQIKDMTFRVLKNKAKKIHIGDEILVQYTSRYGNKKNKWVKIIEQSWASIRASKHEQRYTTFRVVAI